MTQTTSPIDFFSSVTDPRVERTRKYSLDSILFISLCAVICGAESWNEIEDYGNAKIEWLEKTEGQCSAEFLLVEPHRAQHNQECEGIVNGCQRAS